MVNAININQNQLNALRMQLVRFKLNKSYYNTIKMESEGTPISSIQRNPNNQPSHGPDELQQILQPEPSPPIQPQAPPSPPPPPPSMPTQPIMYEDDDDDEEYEYEEYIPKTNSWIDRFGLREAVLVMALIFLFNNEYVFTLFSGFIPETFRSNLVVGLILAILGGILFVVAKTFFLQTY